jgi:hypothetical protein
VLSKRPCRTSRRPERSSASARSRCFFAAGISATAGRGTAGLPRKQPRQRHDRLRRRAATLGPVAYDQSQTCLRDRTRISPGTSRVLLARHAGHRDHRGAAPGVAYADTGSALRRPVRVRPNSCVCCPASVRLLLFSRQRGPDHRNGDDPALRPYRRQLVRRRACDHVDRPLTTIGFGSSGPDVEVSQRRPRDRPNIAPDDSVGLRQGFGLVLPACRARPRGMRGGRVLSGCVARAFVSFR